MVRITVITACFGLCMLYPFLPGRYDALAVTLSAMAQLFGAAGMLMVPIGAVWLGHEWRNHLRRRRGLPHANRGYWFAKLSLVAASVAALATALVALMSTGLSLGLLTAALWLGALSKLTPGLRRLKNAESPNFNAAPIYLIFIPVAAVLFQWFAATPATEFSRNLTIKRSQELIDAIEEHRAAYGRYPESLLAVWPDYHPPVAGIEKFHYARHGEAYHLFFEQPRFLFDNFGTREFVMYNRRDEHLMPSHASWILLWSSGQLSTNQGWYAVHPASSPHWKFFWFD